MLNLISHCWICQMPLYLSHHGLCSVCTRHLPKLCSCCLQCGLPSTNPSLACGRCLIAPPLWNSITFVSFYEPPLSLLIQKMKFQGMTSLALVLARLLLLRWRDLWRGGNIKKPSRIISVPLHVRRCWRRGFNQSDLLARPLARWLNCDYQSDCLTRLRPTPSQRHLNASKRKKNLRGAFQSHLSLKGQSVALVDDVVTTGSTINEISELLIKEGVASLQILCICRTLSFGH